MTDFLCGPSRPDQEDGGPITAVDRDSLTVEDRAAIDTFRGFLAGDLFVCPVCMEADDQCSPENRCCPNCPGVHITARKTPRPEGRHVIQKRTVPTKES